MSGRQAQHYSIPTVRSFRARRGFTIIELLVVIMIMAIIATLATGAATKAIKRVRNNRINTTCRTLESALMSYRAQENQWPVALEPTGNTYQGLENRKVFKPLYNVTGGGGTVYLNASSLLGAYNGRCVPLRELLGKGITDVPLAYPDPDDPSVVRYYRVDFNVATDTAKVSR